MGSKMVRAEMCSEFTGSNRIMLPWSLPGRSSQRQKTQTSMELREISTGSSLPKAILPLRMKVATRMCSYAENLEISLPLRMSHTMAVLPTSKLTASRPAARSLTLSTTIHSMSSRWRSNRRSMARVSWCKTRMLLRWAYKKKDAVEAQGCRSWSRFSGVRVTGGGLGLERVIGARAEGRETEDLVDPELGCAESLADIVRY